MRRNAAAQLRQTWGVLPVETLDDGWRGLARYLYASPGPGDASNRTVMAPYRPGAGTLGTRFQRTSRSPPRTRHPAPQRTPGPPCRAPARTGTGRNASAMGPTWSHRAEEG